MNDSDDLLAVVANLNIDAIRARLDDLKAEEKALKVMLRAALAKERVLHEGEQRRARRSAARKAEAELKDTDGHAR